MTGFQRKPAAEGEKVSMALAQTGSKACTVEVNHHNSRMAKGACFVLQFPAASLSTKTPIIAFNATH